jgi:hypothetical protein
MVQNKTTKESSSKAFSAEQLGASAATAVDVATKAGADAGALVDAWVKTNNIDAVHAVAETGEGVARKAARRGINVLKSRGVKLPDRNKVASLAGDRSPDAALSQALMMSPDPMGVSLFVLVRGIRSERCKACFLFVQGKKRILKIENGELSQAKLREAIRRAVRGAEYDPVPVPLEWARARIAEARRTHVADGEVEPLGFATAQSLLEPVPTDAVTHPFDDEGFELADEDAKTLSTDSAELHRLPEFQSWLPTSASVQGLLLKLGERVGEGEQPPDDEMQKIVEEEIVAATDRYFDEAVRTDLCDRLKDAALSVLARDGESEALKVAALLNVVPKVGLVTEPASSVPFLKAFFQKAMSVLIAQGGGNLRLPIPRRDAEAAPAAG